ncbi:MAG: aldehyde dehydrogenase, partial [Chloroflexi bacterium]
MLHAAERDLRLAAHSRDVDVHHPSFRVLGIAKGRTQVAGIDRGGQSVADGVRGGDGALVVVRRDDAHHRSEDLLLRDAHVRVDVGEDRRLDEVARLQVRFRRCAAIADDADLEKAAESVAGGAFGASGQRCTATSRAIVVRSRLVDFTELLAAKADTWRAGDGLADGVRLGPIVDDLQLRKVRDRIAAGKKEGAR